MKLQKLSSNIKNLSIVVLALALVYGIVRIPSCGPTQIVEKEVSAPVPSGSDAPLPSGVTPGPTLPTGCGKTTFAIVKPIVKKNCVSCHSTFDTFQVAKGKGNDFVTRVNLNPADPRKMPLGAGQLSDSEKQIFKVWQADGFLEDCPTGPVAPKKFYNLDDVEKAIEDEGNKLNADERADSRFLVLTHKVDQGLPESEIATYISGAHKSVNALNTKTGKLEKLPASGPELSILRIELDDFGLNKADWEQVLLNDPFKIESFTNRGRNIKTLFKTKQPWLHADNFTVIAHENANVYYHLTKTPANFAALILKLGVQFSGDQRNFKAYFMGTNKSPISDLKPRLVTQFKSDDGMFWITFDPQALNGVANRSVFNAPLLIDTVNPLEFAAGEIIYTLRNGLQGYALIDAKGNLLKEADIGIVRDTSSPVTAVIKNAISCHRCHAAGVITTVDEVGAHVQQNASNFDPNDVQRVKELYKPQSENDKLFAEYNKGFAKASEALGASVGIDPLTFLTDHFQLNWSLTQLASFVFLTDDQFKAALNQSAQGKVQLGAVLTGSTVTLDQVKIGLPFVIKDARLFQDRLGQ